MLQYLSASDRRPLMMALHCRLCFTVLPCSTHKLATAKVSSRATHIHTHDLPVTLNHVRHTTGMNFVANLLIEEVCTVVCRSGGVDVASLRSQLLLLPHLCRLVRSLRSGSWCACCGIIICEDCTWTKYPSCLSFSSPLRSTSRSSSQTSAATCTAAAFTLRCTQSNGSPPCSPTTSRCVCTVYALCVLSVKDAMACDTVVVVGSDRQSHDVLPPSLPRLMRCDVLYL